ncbi:hypothetical protein Tco_0967896 [Tanacetum coccineum]
MPCTVESVSLEPMFGNKFIAVGEDTWVRHFNIGEEIVQDFINAGSNVMDLGVSYRSSINMRKKDIQKRFDDKDVDGSHAPVMDSRCVVLLEIAKCVVGRV